MNNTNDIFNTEFSRQYDASNKRLSPIADNLHFLISLLVRDLPRDAQILCVGVGTGTEILRLAEAHPGWRFTGVDPSPDMLAVCTEKLAQRGVAARCDLIVGYINDVPPVAKFDAVLCLLVTHFIQHPERQGIYQHMAQRLIDGGQLIVAEIGGDMAAPEFDERLKSWTAIQELTSQQQKSPEEVKALLNQRLLLLPPEKTAALITGAGFSLPHCFFQSLLIYAWQAKKASSAA
ncbi:class I SAM-dependent methyltransferase [Dryocola sp. BD613]|uniref:class I SAM-dependent methyltransferase n=1 Tax=Dryocola sp. BD613 TaxID=3133272 RepID=UPI003F50720F